ncbi:MAG: deoxynucleoside kinase [Candidatus Scalindua rubra]|uniref:Thymidylate kinase n=1 Tax=Candidatus Scalindua brodae TaxID=237368 RepID=A0A0B0ENS1_9BACT|nr:MAG: thymidylate kinase [Candidatus Scalindua brodae]MBZ0108237.1 deoxynucleoside kinase [Candidatus Scalindua rubra]TWU33501.1 Thymidylate kinase [Candidatus Brocadiaceae bacterium S225]
MKKGKLIVVEGTDGSGKTVQTGLLVERLSKEGYQVQMTDFPQYGKSFFANMIEKYLKGEFGWPQELRDHLKKHPPLIEKSSTSGSDSAEYVESRPNEVNPYLTSILYAGDRWEAKNQMRKWLEEGNIVISNRYVCSNMAHQGAKISDAVERKIFYKWIEVLEHEVYSVPKADFTIYLHVPVEISRELITTRLRESEGLKSKMDLHEGDTEYLKRVRDAYVELAASDSNWCTIECAENNKIKSKEGISEEIWHAISRILS